MGTPFRARVNLDSEKDPCCLRRGVSTRSKRNFGNCAGNRGQ